MVFKIDFVDGEAISWTKSSGAIEATRHKDYHPRFYLEGDRSSLQRGRPWISSQDGVVATSFETWRPTLSDPEKKVLRVDVSKESKLKAVVNRLKKNFGRSQFKFYNVGFSPQFRFCIQNEVCPVPEESLSKMELSLRRKQLADNDLSEIEIDGERAGRTEKEALRSLKSHLSHRDPDIIIVNRGKLLELINKKIESSNLNLSLGRLNNFQKLAGDNTVSSYGKTVHSNARYNIPGRILIDESNSFLLGEATLEGLWDLVERSYRPLQELAWGSIGRLLTSIEVRKAYLEKNTLTPWKNWSGEKPKKASTMHKADRGGFIFNPEPSIHYNVYEADFASLFPNIMVKKNISPETVCCDCCQNSKVPELDFSICEKQKGFISEVLKPLVEDRQEMKQMVGDIDDEQERKMVQGSIDAIKWILVSCFGYMGHAHASYGAIKCHQAIQAYDRQIMLETKEMFEKSGYSIAHGIIDSIWVKESSEAEDFQKVCEKVTSEIGIELEPENRFEWCAFVPRSSSNANIATLNRYFGKKQNGEFKTAGIEVEQHSVCDYVKSSQMEMIKALDKDMLVEDVLQVLEKRVERIESGEVKPEKLVKTRKVSKKLENYKAKNRSVAALRRAKKHGIEIKPGQKVEFVVKDDDAMPTQRVRLKFEAQNIDYDTEFYTRELVRAAESVLSPKGLDRDDISRKVLDKTGQLSLADVSSG